MISKQKDRRQRTEDREQKTESKVSREARGEREDTNANGEKLMLLPVLLVGGRSVHFKT